ncbi:TPA: hypothetical protein ACGSBU_004746, partial [Escherichia coli]
KRPKVQNLRLASQFSRLCRRISRGWAILKIAEHKPYSSWRLKGRNMQAIHHVEKFHPKDFDFIALSLAQMNSQGRKVDVEQVTGSMNDACKSRFLDSYRYHLNLFVEKSPS